ncbi:hypothetical protein WAI453_000990 [Rhynchosporium graminicola]
MVKINGVQLSCGHEANGVDCYLTQDAAKIPWSTLVQRVVPGCNHNIESRCSEDGILVELFDITDVTKYVEEASELVITLAHDLVMMVRAVVHVPYPARFNVPILNAHCYATKLVARASSAVLGHVIIKEHVLCHVEHLVLGYLAISDVPILYLICGHQCPSICGESCPEDYCQICSAKQDDRVDLLEMKSYNDIDLDETPIVVLICGHFFTAETLDGMIGMSEFMTWRGLEHL